MHRFHVAIHAAPQPPPARQTHILHERTLATLVLQPHELDRPLPLSFEAAYESLERLPRMFIEPDGSFVWVAQNDEPAWQVDGLLFDRAGQLMYVELKGTCPVERFEQLLGAVGWPATPVVVQLMREAVFVDDTTFREWL